ncbi:MAG TPA: YceD family protein [Polyangiaceae bacterium]
MTKALFVVPLADVERAARTLTFTLEPAWLSQAFEGTDATPRGPGSATVELSKSGKDVMVRGKLHAPISMPCVVTLDPLELDLAPEIFLMLAPAASEPTPKLAKRARAAAAGKDPAAPAEARQAPSRKRSSKEEDEEGELLDERAAARDTFEGSQIELDPFFREFLVLELPMFPRRSDLPSSEGPAIGPPSVEPSEHEPAIDPRLQPLAALRSRMRESKE